MADQVSGLFSSRLRDLRIRAVRPRLEGRVLDYGCGVGLLADEVESDLYVGVDSDAASVAVARERHPEHHFECIDSRVAWPPASLSADRFDTIVMLAVLEHLPAPEVLLRGLSTQLSAGGRLLVTTPNPRFEWAHQLGARLGLFSADASEEHESLVGPDGMATIAKLGGLEVIHFRRFLLGANQLFELRGAVASTSPHS